MTARNVDALPPAPPRHPWSRLLQAGLLTGVVDGIFASLLSIFAYGSTATRLWQGVAATLLGTKALEGGTSTAAVGVLMHFGVAFGWSAVFLLLVLGSSGLRRLLSSPYGVIAAVGLYGPLIWIVMSMAVIPALTGRPAAVNARWWVQLLGHIPFVAVPIVTTIARRSSRDRL